MIQLVGRGSLGSVRKLVFIPTETKIGSLPRHSDGNWINRPRSRTHASISWVDLRYPGAA
eukprot:scaffold127700_cov28-Attheya_sp.AAC.1